MKHQTKCKQCGTVFETEMADLTPRWMVEALTYCETCVGALRRHREAKIEEFRRQERAEWFNELCPPFCRDTVPGKIPNQTALAEVLAWQHGPQGLLLCGKTGTGKTRSAWLLLRRLALEEGRNIATFDSVSFSSQCAARFYSCERDDNGQDWMERLIKKEIVFFDDFAKFKLTERVESELYGLIDARTSWGRPIIYTTNFVGDDLLENMSADRGEPLVRRMREFCVCVTFLPGAP